MNFLKKEQIINALDIGTSSVRIVSAKQGQDSNKLQIIGVGYAQTSGLRKGVVVDIDETAGAIAIAKEMAERASGVPIESVYTTLEGSHIIAQQSRGTIAVSRADGEVSEEDVKRAIDASQAISMPLNREILQVISKTFAIDGQNHIKYPVGMNGVRLEVDVLILEASSPIIKNLTKCVAQAGIDILELVPAPLAASYSVLTKKQKELGVVLIDIGAGTTGLSVFEEGDILHLAILPIGGAHITNDIAIGLKTSVDVAEKIKLEYYKKDQIDLSKISEDEDGIYSKEKIDSIVRARLAEIFNMIEKELRKIDRQKLLPSGAVLVGGGAKMHNIIETAKEYLELPVQIGLPNNLEGVTEQVLDPGFATVIGLVLYAFSQDTKNTANYLPNLNQTTNKVKKWLRTFLP